MDTLWGLVFVVGTLSFFALMNVVYENFVSGERRRIRRLHGKREYQRRLLHSKTPLRKHGSGSYGRD